MSMVVFALLLSRPRHFHCVVSVMCCIASSIGDGVVVCSARLCHVVLHRKTDSAVSTRLRTVVTRIGHGPTSLPNKSMPAVSPGSGGLQTVACGRGVLSLVIDDADDEVVCSDSFCRDVDGLMG